MSFAKTVSVSKYFGITSDHAAAQSFWIATVALCTGIGAQIEISHQPVPYTLQTFFVLLAGAILGKRNGFLSMGLYLTLGIIGLPVFSAGGFGIARIIGPTGGYLLAFPVAAFCIGYLLDDAAPLREGAGKSVVFLRYVWTSIAMFVGLLVIFSLGTLQLNLVYFNDWSAAFTSGLLIFSWWDLLKLVAAVVIYRQFAHRRLEG